MINNDPDKAIYADATDLLDYISLSALSLPLSSSSSNWAANFFPRQTFYQKLN